MQSDLSPRARDKKLTGASYSPKALVTHRLAGASASVPEYPLCALGRSQDTLRDLYGASDAPSWWYEPFEMGRAPYDAIYCAVWHALFEAFAPLERVLARLYRHLLRARRDLVMGRGDQNALKRGELLRAKQ